MVASDSFADFLREQLTPVGHVTLRRMFGKTSVPVLTFVSCRGELVYECQNQGDTSQNMILVRFWI